MLYRAICVVMVLVLSGRAFGQETERRYLSGRGIDDAVEWEFSVSAGRRSGAWARIPVPSCWDAVGFGELSYGRGAKDVLNEVGTYRHRFDVPGEWAGRRVFLVFEGVMTDAAVRVNGISAGPVHQGAFYRFEQEVTELVKVGGENLLEVTVKKQSDNESVNRAERSGDYWNFGGIFRPVVLEARPREFVERVAIDARADGAFGMDVFVAGGGKVRARIVEDRLEKGERGDGGARPGKPAMAQEEGGVIAEAWADVVEGRARVETRVEGPRLWTAETPALYWVEVTLEDGGGRVVHRMRQRFGFRTIEVRPGDGVYVNGVRVLLKGTNRHTFWPDSGRSSSERLSRMDVALMKEMNNNAVRMSHYPPDGHFLEVCDEVGLYVLDELAGWQKSYDEPTARRLVGEMVRRDVNHPSVLFWDNGNEGGWNTAVDDEFAKWDPQKRAVLHPWDPFRGINTKHYPVYELVKKLADGPDVFLPTEFQHALFDGGGGVSLGDYWEVMRKGKASAGGFIWAFVDECVKREDGTLDGAGNQAPDGILGPYREKEGSFDAVKEIWSPVVLRRDEAGNVTVENRYGFTGTERCRFAWELRRFARPGEAGAGHTVIAKGLAVSPKIGPQSSGKLTLELPTERGEADALAVRVEDPDGRELWTWVWEMGSGAERGAKGDAAVPVVREEGAAIRVEAGEVAMEFDKRTGRIASVRRGGRVLPLANGPRLVIGEGRLVSIAHRVEGGEVVVAAVYEGNLKSVEWRVGGDGVVRLEYAYQLDGEVDFFGVGFDLPEREVESMRWLGRGPFRVWKNRLEGGTLGVWENHLNDTQTGYSGWAYPEFKGYYAGVRWMELKTSAGPIRVEVDDPALYVQVLRPTFPGNPRPHSPTTAATRAIQQHRHLSANAWANVPEAGFAILHGIAPMGTKFNIARQLGPQGQQNVARGEYRGSVRFYFGEAAGN